MEQTPVDESGEEAASPSAADVPSSEPSGAVVPSEKASKRKKKKKQKQKREGEDGDGGGVDGHQPHPQSPGGDGAASPVPPASGDAGELRKKRRKKKRPGDTAPGEKPVAPPDGGTAEEIEAALSRTAPALAGARRRSSFGGTLKGRTLRGLLGGSQRRSASPADESEDLAATAPTATEATAAQPESRRPAESNRPGAAALGLLGITATSSDVAGSAEAEEAFMPSPSIAQLMSQSSASSSSLKDMLRTASTGLLGDAQPTGYFRHLFSAGSNLINNVFRGSEEARPDDDAVDGIAPEARAKLVQEKALAQRREREKELAKEQTERAYNLKKVPYSNPDGKGRGWYWGLKSGMPFPSFHQNPNGKFPSRWVDVENVQQPVEDLRAPRLRLAPGEYEKRKGNIEAMKIKALQRPDSDEAAVDTLNFSYQDLGDPYQFRQLQAAVDLNRRVQQLALTDNQLTTISSFYVPHLTTLYVSRNQFMAWTALPAYLPHLHTLYLSHNFISNTIGLSHEGFPALRKLSLEGNPLCDLRDYKARIREALPLLEVLDGKPVAVTYDEATTFKFLQPE